MPFLNAEELSRVLSAHAVGGLKRLGNARKQGYPACIVQAARVNWTGFAPRLRDARVWFDGNYERRWTAEEFIEQLEARRLA